MVGNECRLVLIITGRMGPSSQLLAEASPPLLKSSPKPLGILPDFSLLRVELKRMEIDYQKVSTGRVVEGQGASPQKPLTLCPTVADTDWLLPDFSLGDVELEG